MAKRKQPKTSTKSTTLINSSDKKAPSKKSTKIPNKASSKQKSEYGDNEAWYNYVDINLLLKEKSNNDQDYKVIEAASQDDLQLLQRVNKAFLKLNTLNKPIVIPINIGDKGLDGQYKGSHWVGLVIKKENGTLEAFYNDSLGISMATHLPNLQKILENHGVLQNNISDLCTEQQNDGFNCGPYTVLNLDSLARNGELQEITVEQIADQRKHLAEIKADLDQEEQEVLTVPDRQIKASHKKVDMKKQSCTNSDSLDVNEDDTPFMRQLDNYYSGIVTKLNNLNKDEFIGQVDKLKKMLINLLEDLTTSKKTYSFVEIENEIREKIKETLQKHIVNILTYQVLNGEEYNGEYSATGENIKTADEKMQFLDNSNADRIVHYTNYLIKKNFIPQWLQVSVFKSNEAGQARYDQDLTNWEVTHNGDDYNEDGGDTPPPEQYEWIDANPADAFKHRVFSDPDNLQYLIDFSKDPKEGIGWLIAEYAENIFDSDEAILEIINQNSEDIDPTIAELIFGSLYFYRDYDHEAVLKIFPDETESGYGWLVAAYLTGLCNIQKKGFEQFVQKSIELLTEHYAIVVDSLAEKFQENIDAYNKACLKYDLIAMQKAWYIFSQEQKIYIAAHQKDYTSNTSIKSFEIATNKVLEKVDSEFLSIFPANLKTILYSSKNSKEAPTLDVEAEFKQLATLGQTIKSKMVEIGKTTLTSTNVVVAELLFVVSSERYEKGKTHNKTFVKVPIMFDSDTKLLSRDTTIDLHKIFKLPNSNNILIESIEKDAMENAMPEEKPLAFMSGSKESKFNTETKITNLEESINNLYNDESTSSDTVEGLGVFVHDSSSYWHIYTKVAMDNLLQLRLKGVNLEDSVETFSPNYVFNGSNNIATKLAQEISAKVNNGTLLVKLNLYNKHWVGIALDKNAEEINIQYMDPEQQEMPPLLKGKLAEALAMAYPECQVNITEAEVELQRYNNCGLEVIENFAQYLTGHRLSQEDALPVHALLFEDAIMLAGDSNY